MGGYGSGRGQWGRDTTSSYLQLDVRRLQRERLLVPGNCFARQWLRNGEVCGSIRVRTEVNSVVLSYRHSAGRGDHWQNKEYAVLLEWTRCNFGGWRVWFRCPAVGCSRRVAILYGGSVFACRHCYQLAYDSQREARHNRALMRAQAIRVKLGGSPGVEQPFPPKPKGMHWRTYDGLRAKVDEYVGRSLSPSILRMFEMQRFR